MHACRPSFDKGGPWNDCSYSALPIEASVPDLLPLCTPLHRFRGEHSSDHSSSPHASTHIAHRTGLTALGQANKSMSPGVVAGPHRCRAHSCPIAARSSARVTSIVPASVLLSVAPRVSALCPNRTQHAPSTLRAGAPSPPQGHPGLAAWPPVRPSAPQRRSPRPPRHVRSLLHACHPALLNVAPPSPAPLRSLSRCMGLPIATQSSSRILYASSLSQPPVPHARPIRASPLASPSPRLVVQHVRPFCASSPRPVWLSSSRCAPLTLAQAPTAATRAPHGAAAPSPHLHELLGMAAPSPCPSPA